MPADVPRPLPIGWYGHLHNIYLQYAAERGIPTMLVLMWMLGQILFDFWRGLRVLPPGRGNRTVSAARRHRRGAGHPGGGLRRIQPGRQRSPDHVPGGGGVRISGAGESDIVD